MGLDDLVRLDRLLTLHVPERQGMCIVAGHELQVILPFQEDYITIWIFYLGDPLAIMIPQL